MSGWILLNEGRKRPPRTPRRRRLWAWIVLVVSLALAPFLIAGVVERWALGDLLGGVAMTFASGLAVLGVVVALRALFASFRGKG